MDEQRSSLSELDNRIMHFQNIISLSSKSHPRHVRSVINLADARFERYKLSHQQDDLNRSILGKMEAIFLPYPWHDHSLLFVKTFWDLTAVLSIRATELKQPEDVKSCITFFRYLHNQHHKVIPDLTTAYFVEALAIKVELELGDVREDIEEIADLCHKRLSSDISMRSQEYFLGALERVVGALFGRGRIREEEKVIQCLREANMRLPDLHEAPLTLADALFLRFEGTGSIDDYEEGTAILDEVIAGDTPSPYNEKALGLAADFAKARFNKFGRPDHLEEVIYRFRNILDMISPDHPDHSFASHMFSAFRKFRGLDQVDIGGSDFESRSKPSFRDLTTSLAQSNMDTFSIKPYHAMACIINLTDISEIEDAIKYCRQLLDSRLGGHTKAIASEGLGIALIHAFNCTNKIEYLNEAISVIQDDLSQDSDWSTAYELIRHLTTRFKLLHHEEDLNKLMQLFPITANDIRAPIPERFELSCQWALFARASRHPSPSTAYDHAISLMQATLTFSPTLHSQHLRLVAMGGSYEELPLDYASYLVRRGQLKKAIEILERGRALIWSEMRGFRTSIHKIRTASSDLADRFAAVNKELEMLTLTSSNDLDGTGDNGIKRMGPYGDLVVRQQRLFDDREMLISQIQALPGFENFLTSPSFDTLRSAALHGPVIMINHCDWRSDILILLRDSPPSLIHTNEDFYGRGNKLRDQLLDTKTKGLESRDYEDALNSVLEELYELVGRPVIKRLNELHIPEQSRVWWCPTSAFCSLPLHAMGPIPSEDGPKRYFMDLYIPSYIPSLSALIDSRKSNSQTLDKPSILLVVQPDEYMPEALKEMKVVRAVNTQVTTLFSKMATPTAVLSCLRDHRFAHIVCHGTLEVGKPFDASFKLYADERLSLLDIVRSQLPNAEFAFLSACHTAELTEESIADEGLHLTAAMQYCGFRSVVGTMWAMADVDGRDLARDFYTLVFADQRPGVRYYERTAEALRGAVQRLRRKGGIASERWVNFVHYGA